MPRPAPILLCVALACGCRARGEVVVFHSISLTAPLGEVAQQLERDSPGVRVRLEPCEGSLAVRKLLELGQPADLVVVGDSLELAPLIEAHKIHSATVFATDEVVLAHQDHSRFTDEISTANWPQVLDRPGVRVGCADPTTSDVGLHAQLAWQLAGQQALRNRCTPDRTVTGELELVGLLESRAVDYVFLHRSTAEGHRLKLTALPKEWNLSEPGLEDAYRTASVTLAGKPRAGAAIACAAAIPEAAANVAGARLFLDALLSTKGRQALSRAGFHPLASPATYPALRP
jgi:molybdate/tungstate transport system substrate-binding protein